MDNIAAKDALEYHRMGGRPGKLCITPTKPLETQRDLSLAYTPGVATPVLEIERNPDCAYEYTNKGNLVAVISNGTAILGLGNRGPLASKPVMEGKAVLFKKFADIDVFDLEIKATSCEMFEEIIAALEPTFGGINLEDIRAPECFEVENNLQNRMNIPVFHDDQHGTAIIVSAAFLNCLEISGKKMDQIKIVFCGAGAAGIACANQFRALGVPLNNIWLTDSLGLVYQGRQQRMSKEKLEYAKGDQPATLAEVIKDADMFIGLSTADILTPEMLQTMARDPIIFAMANPNPEVRYEVAKAARPDGIIATGRSDYPNQINNILCFPFIFRGALDVRARKINEEMKMAASHALAHLARQPVPKEVCQAYNIDHLEFGRDYFVPKPFDKRVVVWEASAVARAAIDSGVSYLTIDIEDYRSQLAHKFGIKA